MSATLRPVPATVLPNGTVRLLEDVRLPFPAMVMVTLLIEEGAANVPETAVLSKDALMDWNRDEEEAAWAHLQEARDCACILKVSSDWARPAPLT